MEIKKIRCEYLTNPICIGIKSPIITWTLSGIKTQKGFEIKPQYPILDNFRADIYAIKDDEKVAIEFVHISDSEESMQNLKQLAAEEGITLRFIDISKIQIQLKDNDTVKTN